MQEYNELDKEINEMKSEKLILKMEIDSLKKFIPGAS